MKKYFMRSMMLAAGLSLTLPLFAACSVTPKKDLSYDDGVVRAFYTVDLADEVISRTAAENGQNYLVTVITPSSVAEYTVGKTFEVENVTPIVGEAPSVVSLAATEETKELSDLERAFEKALELSGIAKAEVEGFDFDKTTYMKKAVFKVEIEDGQAEYTYIFDAADLSVLESKTELKSTAPVEGEQSSYIGEEQAKAIALGTLGIDESAAENFTLKSYLDGGRRFYKASFGYNGFRYTVDIDAVNGNIVKFSQNILDESVQNPDIPSIITEEQAKEIAVSFAFPNGTDGVTVNFLKTKLDYEKGKFVYEIEFTADGNEYEFEIAASDGTILDVEIDKKDVTPPQSGEFITREQAIEKVKTLAGEDALILDVEIEKERKNGETRYYYEIEVKANGKKTEYLVDAVTGEVTLNEEYAGNPADPTPALTEEEALQIALDNFKLTEDMLTYKKIKLEREDGRLCYEIKLLVGNVEYKMTLDARTGTIVEQEIDREHGEELPPQSSESYITPEQARKAVEEHLAAAGRTGHIKDVELEDRGTGANKTFYYEVEIVVDGREYDCYVDAVTGEVTLKGELMDGNQTLIGEERALSIALEYFSFTKSEVRLIKIELEEDDGILIYEVEFKQKSMEYTVEIDAVTGDILDFDKSFD